MSYTNPVQFINGRWQAGLGYQVSSVNPARNKIIWQGKTANAAQVNAAVVSARQAFKSWGTVDLHARIALVTRFAALLNENKAAFATTISLETGKTKWEGTGEVAAMITKVASSLKAYQERTSTVEHSMPDAKTVIRHKPHGVIAVFGPYNFPGHLPNGHIIPALIAGNTIVLKPSELTPLVAEEMLKLWQQAGLPNGVINLVQGEIATGKYLASHKLIDGIFFTGSSTTGHLLHQQLSGQPEKILALEMGGNNPLIVKDVSDIDAVVHDIVQSAFITTGQRCTCARRLFIEENKQGDAILAKLIKVTNNLTIGHFDDEKEPFMGSMISEGSALTLVAAQAKLVALGAKPIITLKHLAVGTGFVSPGIIDVSDIIAELPDEEYFGPLLKVYRYNNFVDAIDEANNTRFGLSAGLLSDSKVLYKHFFTHIRAGIINWNKPITGASSTAPFGGIGASGNHRASALYAADYCVYPIASIEAEKVHLPTNLTPGLKI